MRKTSVLICLLVVLFSLTAPLWASAADSQRLLAQVQINPDLRPGAAAYIPVQSAPGQSNQNAAANVANVILQLIAGSLIYAAGPIAVLMLVVGGFRYVISHGDQTQMEAAKKNITWAIIGLLVILLSWIIVSNVIKVVTTTAVGGSTSAQPSAAQQPPVVNSVARPQNQ
jgi:hypothetical protein